MKSLQTNGFNVSAVLIVIEENICSFFNLDIILSVLCDNS